MAHIGDFKNILIMLLKITKFAVLLNAIYLTSSSFYSHFYCRETHVCLHLSLVFLWVELILTCQNLSGIYVTLFGRWQIRLFLGIISSPMVLTIGVDNIIFFVCLSQFQIGSLFETLWCCVYTHFCVTVVTI